MNKIKELRYSLTFDEVRKALYDIGRQKPYRSKSIFQTVLALIATLLFVSNILAAPENTVNYLIVVVCIGLIPFLWILPKSLEKRIVESYLEDGETTLEFHENYIKINQIHIRTAKEDGDIINIKQTESCYVFVLKSRNVAIVPIRAIDSEEAKEYFNTLTEEKTGEQQ